MPDNIQLTPVEHELMEILWQLGSGTVRDVMAQLPKKRDLAYTSVSTILRILQQKKILRAIKAGRQHCYEPILKKASYTTHSIHKMVDHVFAGKPVELVVHLVKERNLSIEEINALQKLLNEKKQELKKC